MTPGQPTMGRARQPILRITPVGYPSHPVGGTMPHVLYEVADRVATITLNRQARRNALTGPMLDDLAEKVRVADADPGVPAIGLTGAGEGFCAGLDLAEVAVPGLEARDEFGVSYRPERVPVVVMPLADTP